MLGETQHSRRRSLIAHRQNTVLSGECIRARPLRRNSSLGANCPCGMLQADRLTHHYSSVPTQDQILVPETLLKKRKSAEKEAADKAAQRETRKKVSPTTPFHQPYGDETYPQHLD